MIIRPIRNNAQAAQTTPGKKMRKNLKFLCARFFMLLQLQKEIQAKSMGSVPAARQKNAIFLHVYPIMESG